MTSFYDLSYSYDQQLLEANEGTAQGKQSSSVLSVSLLAHCIAGEQRAPTLRALEGVASVSHCECAPFGGTHCNQCRSNTQAPGMGHSDNSEELYKKFTIQIS